MKKILFFVIINLLFQSIIILIHPSDIHFTLIETGWVLLSLFLPTVKDEPSKTYIYTNHGKVEVY